MNFRPLTAELVRRMYSDVPASMRGYALFEGDEPKVIFGLYYDSPMWVAFMKETPDFRERISSMQCKRAMVKGALMLIGLIEKTSGHVRAVAEQFERAPAFLERIGFRRLVDNVYEWPRHG